MVKARNVIDTKLASLFLIDLELEFQIWPIGFENSQSTQGLFTKILHFVKCETPVLIYILYVQLVVQIIPLRQIHTWYTAVGVSLCIQININICVLGPNQIELLLESQWDCWRQLLSPFCLHTPIDFLIRNSIQHPNHPSIHMCRIESWGFSAFTGNFLPITKS